MALDGDKSRAFEEDSHHGVEPQVEQNGLHLARRGGDMVDSDIDSSDIQGFDTDRMRARTLLTAEEEKKLLRRIDWHIMPLCSFSTFHLLASPVGYYATIHPTQMGDLPLCFVPCLRRLLIFLVFLLKNMDAQNISNARIMNEGTPRNIMTQLSLSSNEYALLAALYYV